LLPAATDVGAAEFVVIRSACVAVATTSAAVAVLFPAFGSVVEELTVTVSLIAVPAAVPAFTLTTKVIVALPTARLGFVQVRVPRTQVHPAGPVSDCAVVFAGRVSVTVTLLAALGPGLVTTCVYVMLLFACTGTGLAEFVIERSAEFPTTTLADALLFPKVGSPVVAETESVCVIVVPDATLLFTFTTKVKFAVAFAARLAIVHAGGTLTTLHVHPAGPVNETTVVFAGTGSLKVIVLAVAGPPFVTDCV